MARPIKTGLDYFSFDVDFYENRKVKKVMRACGPASGTVLSCLLCNIYRWKGYYALWDEDLPFDIADKVGLSEGAVTEIITKSIQVGFFDKHQFENNRILTSLEIQKRFLTSTMKRVESVIDVNYLVPEGENQVSDAETPVSGGDNPQSKVKESKVNKRREDPHRDPNMFFDAEDIILSNQIQFEKICCAAPKNLSVDQIKEALRKYHLHLEENDRYPMNKRQLYAGFEKWILNEKNFSNGSKTHQQSSAKGSAGTSTNRTEALKEWSLGG